MAEQPAFNINDDKDKNEISCETCAKVLSKDHTGVICEGDHHICTECSKSYANTVFDEPEQSIPLKCSKCSANIIVETFERQLTQKQAQTFLQYNIKFDPAFLDENEIVAGCPFCQYFEITTQDQGRLLFLCKNDKCHESSCIWCKKSIKNKMNDVIEKKQDDSKYDIDENEFESHLICAQLAPHKQKWDKAIETGNMFPCSKCGLGGMKNNACTHMNCVKCQSRWCYVCGLPLEELDKDPQFNNFMGHNLEWKTNPKRCPMWLDNINEVDKRWPENDSEGCVFFLHQLRTMKLLKNVIGELGDENYEAICEKYKVDENCGYNMKEVMEGDHTLIIRNTEPENNQQL